MLKAARFQYGERQHSRLIISVVLLFYSSLYFCHCHKLACCMELAGIFHSLCQVTIQMKTGFRVKCVTDLLRNRINIEENKSAHHQTLICIEMKLTFQSD